MCKGNWYNLSQAAWSTLYQDTRFSAEAISVLSMYPIVVPMRMNFDKPVLAWSMNNMNSDFAVHHSRGLSAKRKRRVAGALQRRRHRQARQRRSEFVFAFHCPCVPAVYGWMKVRSLRLPSLLSYIVTSRTPGRGPHNGKYINCSQRSTYDPVYRYSPPPRYQSHPLRPPRRAPLLSVIPRHFDVYAWPLLHCHAFDPWEAIH